MRGAVRPADCIDEIVDDADADSIPRRRHGRTSVPEVGRGIEAIHGVRILIPVRGVVSSSDGVKQTSNHSSTWIEYWPYVIQSTVMTSMSMSCTNTQIEKPSPYLNPNVGGLKVPVESMYFPSGSSIPYSIVSVVSIHLQIVK